MDKDMMNIDDLFKEKLSEGEEKERPGAWLLMKDILNEKMPAAVAVGTVLYNWRRIYSFFAGAAVVGSVIIGYKAMHKNDGHGGDNGKVASVSNTIAANTPVASTKPTVSLSNTQQNATNTTSNKTNTEKTVAPVKVASASSNKTTNTVAVNKVNNVLHSANTPKTTTTTNNGANNNTNKLDNYNKNSKPANNNSNLLASGNTPNNKPEPKPQAPTSKVDNAAPGNSQNNTQPAVANNNRPVVQPTTVPSPAPSRTTQDPHVTNPRYLDRTAKMDSAELLVIKETVRRGKVTTTTTQGMIARPKNNLPETEQDFYNSPAQQATTSSVDEAALVNLSTKKVESKMYKSRTNSNLFEEMVKNVSVDLSAISFHGGLMGGINSSIGAYRMTGFQLGVAGMMNISDHWMMFGELKYLHRFGNNKSLSNNYNRVGTPLYLGNNTFNYQWDSVEHYFNISSSGLIELPVAIRYSVRRVGVFAGINASYYFPLNIEEKENYIAKDYISTESLAAVKSKIETQETIMKTSDFGSRFSLGATLGFAYQVSPAIGVDLRVCQPFWDNVKTKGAYEVSKALYRVPSLQFNVTYRFSNNNYRMR